MRKQLDYQLKRNCKYIDKFNMYTDLAEDAYSLYKEDFISFDAGTSFKCFNEYIASEFLEDISNGDGVTYTIWNLSLDEDENEKDRDLVAYYTLSASAIPYEDRIRKDEEDITDDGEIYDIKICGLSAIEIKMFAIDQRYQDVFFEFEGDDMPIAAWVLRQVENNILELLYRTLSFKVIVLRSVPTAENFYYRNGFNYIKENMLPLHDINADCKVMYTTLIDVPMNYDD